MASLARLFARSTKAAAQSVPKVSRAAEKEANGAVEVAYKGEEGRRWLEAGGRTGRTLLYAAPPVAIAGGIGYSVYQSWKVVPDIVNDTRKDIAQGAHDIGQGLLHIADEAMNLPAAIAGGLPALSSGHTMELVAVTVVALGAGFVLVHYVTN
jgi:hypothetical protein